VALSFLCIGSSFGVVHAPFIDDPLERISLTFISFVFIKYKIVNGTTQTAEIERKVRFDDLLFLIQNGSQLYCPFVPVLLKAVAVKHFILESVNTPPKINYLIDSTVGGNLIVDLVVGVVNKLLVRLNIHYVVRVNRYA
jgi:hypothetical protein